MDWLKCRAPPAPNAGQAGERQERSLTAGGNAEGAAALEDWGFLTKLNMLLPYDRAVLLLGVSPKELKATVYTETCTPMCAAALLLIASVWEAPKTSFSL